MKKRGRKRPKSVKEAANPKFRLRNLNDTTAVLLFLIFLVVIIFLLDAAADQKAIAEGKRINFGEKITAETTAKKILDVLSNDGMPDELPKRNYRQLRNEIGISNNMEFVIHFEDGEGNVIPIDGKLCIGSKDAVINGVSCS